LDPGQKNLSIAGVKECVEKTESDDRKKRQCSEKRLRLPKEQNSITRGGSTTDCHEVYGAKGGSKERRGHEREKTRYTAVGC